jgi:hypothetical protein
VNNKANNINHCVERMSKGGWLADKKGTEHVLTSPDRSYKSASILPKEHGNVPSVEQLPGERPFSLGIGTGYKLTPCIHD